MGYVFSLSNLERDLHARYALLKRRFIKGKTVDLRERLKQRRIFLGTTHTLDLSWPNERFKQELEAVEWDRVFPSEEEMSDLFNDHPELTYMYRSSNER
jgi:hypothetical protein